MTKEKAPQIKPKRAKTPNKDHKQPNSDNITLTTDILTDNIEVMPRIDRERLTRLWLHGLTNKEIEEELGIHIQTVLAHVSKLEQDYKSLPVDMLKSKTENAILKLMVDSDMILRRYSIELSRLDDTKDNTTLNKFITIARALESQAKTLTDCLVRMGVVQTPVKGKGTQYPHSPTNDNSEELTKIEEKGELIKYHERRLKALKRKEKKDD